jgi:hypothetical protein
MRPESKVTSDSPPTMSLSGDIIKASSAMLFHASLACDLYYPDLWRLGENSPSPIEALDLRTIVFNNRAAAM